MRDSELRGIILEALYNQRRKDSVNLDQELGGLPVPRGAAESILRQLVKKGLVERPIQPLNGLGTGRITAYGIDVVQGKTKTVVPPDVTGSCPPAMLKSCGSSNRHVGAPLLRRLAPQVRE